ncbi:MAG: ArsR/SmtB family transcription factor [Anaerovoracaceae bacterium]|nr:metalloregulator ArsR/SmtB family transcription factor [Clostridiales bacterium]
MQIPDKRTIILIAELFKGFDDPTRVQILSSLIGREMCVNEIAEAAELSQSATSHQLRILKRMRLVKFRREGKNLLYSLADDHVLTILKTGLDYVYSDT